MTKQNIMRYQYLFQKVFQTGQMDASELEELEGAIKELEQWRLYGNELRVN